MDHKIARRQGGEGIEGWILPFCTCGWFGRKHYAHNDYQHSNCTDEEQRHLDDEARKDNDAGSIVKEDK